MKKWYMYVVRCIDGSLYAGITIDIRRRILEHNFGMKGAKYTRSRRPVTLLHVEECDNHSDALRREHKFKKLSKKRKEEMMGLGDDPTDVWKMWGDQ